MSTTPSYYQQQPQQPHPQSARSNAPPEPDEGTIILCMVDNLIYPITEEAIQTILTAYGDVVQTVVYEKPGVWQAIVQYADVSSANAARQALEGHAIYEGGYNKLRVFPSSKEAMAYASAAIASPDYKVPDQDTPGIRAVVNGDDYVRVHSEIGRGAMASITGQPLPSSFIPTTFPPPGTVVPVATLPVAGSPPMYLHHHQHHQQHHPQTDPYLAGVAPRAPYGPTAMSPSFHQLTTPMNFQRIQDMRYAQTIPMTTYQQHPPPMPTRPMRNPQQGSHHGVNMMISGERPKQT